MMQGTAATVLAGIYGALKVQEKPLSALMDQRIVMVGKLVTAIERKIL